MYQQIEAIRAEPPATLVVTWKDGSSSRVDLSGPIARNPALAPLRDPTLFSRARVGEWGWSVTWTDDIDLSAEQLWRWGGEQAGEFMPAEEFRMWRARHGLSLTGAAKALGLSRRTVAYYDGGGRPIPKTVLLATKGYDAERAA